MSRQMAKLVQALRESDYDIVSVDVGDHVEVLSRMALLKRIQPVRTLDARHDVIAAMTSAGLPVEAAEMCLEAYERALFLEEEDTQDELPTITTRKPTGAQ